MLFGKGLAQRWQALEDSEQKIKIRSLIRLLWEGRWDEEPNGKAMKTAKDIYSEEL